MLNEIKKSKEDMTEGGEKMLKKRRPKKGDKGKIAEEINRYERGTVE